MVGSEEKRRLIDDYREPLDARVVVAKSVAGLLIAAVIAAAGASSAEPHEMYAAKVRAKPDAAKGSAGSDSAKVSAKSDAAEISGKQVETGR